MRQNQRALRKITRYISSNYLLYSFIRGNVSFFSERELDRERGQLERQEKKIIADVKKMAKTGQMVYNYMEDLITTFIMSFREL